MKKILNIITFTFLASILFTQCKNDDEDNSPKFQFVSGGKYFSASSDSVDVGDTIIIKWSISTIAKMKYMLIEDKGATSTSVYNFKDMANNILTKHTDTLTNSMMHAYSDTFAIKIISSGTASLRFTVVDSLNNVIARADLPVNIRSDYYYYTKRILYIPDSIVPPADAKCYLAPSTGKTYSFNELNTALLSTIDLGHTFSSSNYVFYSLTNNQYSTNNLSILAPTRVTYLKSVKSVTETSIRNAATIVSTCGTIGTATTVSVASADIKTYQIAFKNDEGKYGLLWVVFASSDSIRFNIKMQK